MLLATTTAHFPPAAQGEKKRERWTPLSAPRRSCPPRPPSTRPLLVSRSCSTSCLSLPGDVMPRGENSECSGDPLGRRGPNRGPDPGTKMSSQCLYTFSRINRFMKLVQPILLGPDFYSSRARGGGNIGGRRSVDSEQTPPREEGGSSEGGRCRDRRETNGRR